MRIRPCCATRCWTRWRLLADNRLTIADLKVFTLVRGLNASRLDHMPTDLVEKVAPLLSAHTQRIAQTPAMAQYYAKFGA